MPTYISMLNWSGDPQPSAADVRAAIDARSPSFRNRGLHSVAFLPDEGECAAVMVARCVDRAAVAALAASILPSSEVRVDSMLFDDDPALPARVAREVVPPPPGNQRRPLLYIIVADG